MSGSFLFEQLIHTKKEGITMTTKQIPDRTLAIARYIVSQRPKQYTKLHLTLLLYYVYAYQLLWYESSNVSGQFYPRKEKKKLLLYHKELEHWLQRVPNGITLELKHFPNDPTNVSHLMKQDVSDVLQEYGKLTEYELKNLVQDSYPLKRAKCKQTNSTSHSPVVVSAKDVYDVMLASTMNINIVDMTSLSNRKQKQLTRYQQNRNRIKKHIM